MHTISFILEPQEVFAAGRKHDGPAWVRAEIDGHSIGDASMPLDLLALLAYKGISGNNLTVLNCTCGVPACAGFHENCHQVVEDHVVRWRLSADEYGSLLPMAQACPGKEGWIELPFQRSQYETALEDGLRQIEEALRLARLRLQPCAEDSIADARQMQKQLEAARNWERRTRERQAWSARVFQCVAGQTLEIKCSGGATLAADAAVTLQKLLEFKPESRAMDTQARQDWIEREMARHWSVRLAEDPAAVFQDLVDSTDWDDLRMGLALRRGRYPIQRPQRMRASLSPQPYMS